MGKTCGTCAEYDRENRNCPQSVGFDRCHETYLPTHVCHIPEYYTYCDSLEFAARDLYRDLDSEWLSIEDHERYADRLRVLGVEV